MAGKRLTGWIVIDMDATIIVSSSKKQGAAATFKKTHMAACSRADLGDGQPHRFVQAFQEPVRGGVGGGRPKQGPLVQLELFGIGHARGPEDDRRGQAQQDMRAIAPGCTAPGREQPLQRRRQPDPVRDLVQQHRPRVPDQSLPVSHHTQPVAPPCTLTHRKGAPVLAADPTSAIASLQLRGTFS
ncbi:hypothetical protein [Actinacidiphila oryziradicis]|uniref:hypothetical protein n=1 Tax=Actinacidiphila oryziradicis TaxID=2571141 RepID=UPI0026CDF6D8|nr:hypothetical protein [Actinacidiphila oryziradicis]